MASLLVSEQGPIQDGDGYPATGLTMRAFRHLLVLLCSAVASAAFATSVRSSGASIFVNEVEVVKLRSSVGGHSPAERAGILAAQLETNLQKGTATVSAAPKLVRILIGDDPWL